jgi:hypothetical protein
MTGNQVRRTEETIREISNEKRDRNKVKGKLIANGFNRNSETDFQLPMRRYQRSKDLICPMTKSSADDTICVSLQRNGN